MAVRKVMSINLSIGSRLPAWCTSMGRVMLSALPDDELDAALRRADIRQHTRRTVTDIDTLRQRILDVRAQGWAIVDQELEEGMISIAAPIRNRAGQVIAAMNVSGQANRTSAAEMEATFLAPLLAAAQKISQMVVV